MTELLTAAQMRAIEQAAIDSGEVTGLELMERAGRGVVEAIFEEWPELALTSHRAVVLCGPGNNGGDGFVVARLLKEWGWEVEVFLYGTPEKMPPDARANYERWLGMGELKTLTESEFRAPHPDYENAYADLYVDAIFGTGLTRLPEGDLAGLLRHLGGFGGERYPRLVAIDAPSGLCLDSGRMLIGGWARPSAALTVTFDCLQAGHFLNEGPERCGRVVVVDIGVGTWRQLQNPVRKRGHWTGIKRRVELGLAGPCAEGLAVAGMLPGGVILKMLCKAGWTDAQNTHKFAFGHALIVSGDHGRAGAARLAARGALRIGAGVVTLASPPAAMAESAARLDAIMLREVAGGEELAEVLADKRINALCLGPGMGTGEREAQVLRTALVSGRSLVLDADSLTILSQHADLFAALQPTCVLTPHAGEFARLFPDIAAKLDAPATKGPAYSKVDATREAAARAACVVLFKGPDTVIAAPDGRCAINSAHYDRAAPWLATAGSGDVLAGFITGLLARGFNAFDAACTGAWLHVECARSFGPGLIAEDLAEQLPKVFRKLGL